MKRKAAELIVEVSYSEALVFCWRAVLGTILTRRDLYDYAFEFLRNVGEIP